MREYLAEIPVFFGFENCSIMFYDNECDNLYTITYGDDKDNKQNYDIQMKDATTDKEKEIIQIIYNLKDVIIPGTGLIRFPINTGITGKVFMKQSPLFYNQMDIP